MIKRRGRIIILIDDTVEEEMGQILKPLTRRIRKMEE